MCCENGPQAFDQVVGQLVNTFGELLSDPNARYGTNAAPAENALSSLGKLLLHRKNSVGQQYPQLLDQWVQWLPAEVDEVSSTLLMSLSSFLCIRLRLV